MKAYAEDLAYIHDAGFSDFVRSATPGLLRILRRSGIESGGVVELGCGGGRLALALSRAGYDVLGVDISPSMIKLARERAPRARFRTGSLLRVKLPPCNHIISIGECVNYLFDRKNGKREVWRLFQRVHDALRPGGIFIFDVAEPGRVLNETPRRAFFEGKDWAILLEVKGDRKRNLLTRRITSFRQVGKLYRRSEEVHRLRLYDESELVAELRRVGFDVRIIRGYGQFRFRGRFVGFVAIR
jgi:SAM-dependent methyltransferase